MNDYTVTGRLDQSGFRLHMTPTLRENDIGVILVGASVEKAVMIPPHYNDLTYRGYCMPECLQTVRCCKNFQFISVREKFIVHSGFNSAAF